MRDDSKGLASATVTYQSHHPSFFDESTIMVDLVKKGDPTSMKPRKHVRINTGLECISDQNLPLQATSSAMPPPIQPLRVDDEQQSFASRLNQMRIAQIEFRNQSGPVSFEQPACSYTQSPMNIHNSNPITESVEDDCRDISSTSQSRDDTDASQSRDEIQRALRSGSEAVGERHEELMTDQISVRDLTMKLSKFINENELLRKNVAKLTQENVSFRSAYDNGELVQDLRNAVTREREFCKSQMKDLEMRLASTQDNLSETEKRLQSKANGEKTLAQRISKLESHLAGQKAEYSSIKAALEGETAAKTLLQADLQTRLEEIDILTARVRQAELEVETSLSRYDDTMKELETMREIDQAHRGKIKELQCNLDEREIQVRAITESKGISDKTNKRLDQANESLTVKCNQLKEILENNSKSFETHVQKLEKTIADLVSDRDTLVNDTGQMVSEIKQKDIAIRDMTEKNSTLILKIREAEEREVNLVEDVNERNRLHGQNEVLHVKIESLEEKVVEITLAAERKTNDFDILQESFHGIQAELASAEQSVEKIQEKRSELEKKLGAVILENEGKSSLIQVLQGSISAYKSELQRLITAQANEERSYAMASNRLVEYESRLVTSETIRDELKKQVNESRLQTKQIAEVTTRFQAKVAEQSQIIEALNDENRRLVEKNAHLCEACIQLKVLTEQCKQSEENQRINLDELRGLQIHKGDLIKELESLICVLRAEISALHDKIKDTTRRSLDSEAAASKVVAELERDKRNLVNDAMLAEETIETLQTAKHILEEENLQMRQGIANVNDRTADNSVITELAQINAENLLRIYELVTLQVEEIARGEEASRLAEDAKLAAAKIIDSLSANLKQSLENNALLQHDFDEAHENPMARINRQREIEAEIKSVQAIKDDELRTNIAEKAGCAQNECVLNKSYQTEVVRLLKSNSVLEHDLSEIVGNNKKECRLNKSCQMEVARLLKANSALNDDLLIAEKAGNTEKEGRLNKSYQIEAARLLKVISSLKVELDRLYLQNEDLQNQIMKAEQVKTMYEQCARESSAKVANILSKIASDPRVEDKLVRDNDTFSRENQSDLEAKISNCSNIESFVKNMQILEETILSFFSIRRPQLATNNGIGNHGMEHKNSITELNDAVERLESGRENMEIDKPTWVDEILGIVAEYDTTQRVSQEGDPTFCDLRENIIKRVRDTFQNQHSRIEKLRENLIIGVGKVAEYHSEQNKLIETVRTLRLENKILKAAGKEREKRATTAQQTLYKENKLLRESVGNLRQQRNEHKLKIMKIASRQARLQGEKGDDPHVGIKEIMDKSTCDRPPEYNDLFPTHSEGSRSAEAGSVEVVLVDETICEKSA